MVGDDRAAARRLRMTVEYDGTDFLGFQRQVTGRTVQAILEAALATVTSAPRVVAAGRTDTGVHASGQVLHCDYAGGIPIGKLAEVLNSRLPADLAVRECREATPGFHARYSALTRTYRYCLFQSATRQPLRERYAWRIDGALDLPAMAAASALLVGTHGFRRFGQIPGNAEQRRRSQAGHGWRRTIYRADVDGRPDGIAVTVEADAFLTHMMRALIGALAAVAQGRLGAEALASALDDDTTDRAIAPLAPPHGLCLVEVRYPPDET